MRKALVIGGGVAGPVAAVALREVGIEAVVYEAHSGPGDGLGSFLTLAPNGLAALEVLGLLEPVRAVAADSTCRIELVNASGRRLGLVGDGSEKGPDRLRTVTVRRDALQRALAEAARDHGVRIEYGKRFTGYTETPAGVVAEFADGTTAEGDVLIGADGIRSRVRGLMDPGAPRAEYTGLLNIGGHTPPVEVAPTPDATMRMVFGRRAFFGYQAVPGEEVLWFVNVAHEEMTRERIAARSDDEWKRFTLDLFSGDLSDITTILAAADPACFRPLGIDDVPSLPRWHRGRAVLLGDAAHAVSSSSGQGASLAAEDALVLAKCLRDVDGLPEALGGYESLRRDRVERIAAEGRKQGSRKGGSPNPVALAVRDLVLRVVFAIAGRSGGRGWMHDYRVDLREPLGVDGIGT
ncbi:FAD-dependent monooxygenase [Nocardiopsis lucentensis]|uniref:FAD-dependent monooxygenase n=1 Tax=Nocardiopsis lucentensis TaxID=53441 RepID=UPI0003479453|nr:FAD-dependent monooxygenase [Nocardiopsis lucentensis]